MREVAWVIFDEIHYMRDKGITWLQSGSVLMKVYLVWFERSLKHCLFN